MEMATEEINTTGCDGLPESTQDTHMNDSGESQKEITDRKTEVLSAKTKTRIGLWNMRTMYDSVGQLECENGKEQHKSW